MSEWGQFVQHLKQPEYLHVLLNPLPVYATAMGVVALAVAFFLRNRQAQFAALVIIILGCLSAWPAEKYGEGGYDRVYSMSNRDAQQWLDVHMQRAERFSFVFYVTAALAAATIVTQWKFPKANQPLAIATLVLAVVSVGTGAWIGHAGGQVRHSEFRDGPPPVPAEHHEHGSSNHAEEGHEH